ncbi:MAG TPA: alpha/beta hydrolase [Streptosporangiaceae bacterium]|nr:alpha/beta hydrolase [Streptosporangiaceae bacterium]
MSLPNGQLFLRSAPAVTVPGAEPAEPALFIHGLGGSSTNWTDLMDLLSRPSDAHLVAPVLDCTAVDLPGFGFSPPAADGRYTISAHAEAVARLIEQQGNGPVHLISNSMGGAVGTRLAARRPDLVRSLVLISPALPDLRPRPLPLRLAVATVPAVGPRLMEWLRKQPAESRTDHTISDLFNDPALFHPLRRDAEIAEVLRRDGLPYANIALVLSARSLVLEYFKVGRSSLWHDATTVRAPVLILHGSHDRLVNPVMAGKAARAFRGGRVLVLSGVGHVAMMERPAVVAREIRSFLDWVRVRGARPASTGRRPTGRT